MSRFTIDTNILFYTTEANDRRLDLALDILGRARFSDCLITLQAYGEFYNACVRKQRATPGAARAQVDRWLALFGAPLIGSVDTLSQAMAATGRFSFWDAMLLAAAEAAGCTAIISEDMAPGATLGRLRVVPAFNGDAVSPEALALLAST